MHVLTLTVILVLVVVEGIAALPISKRDYEQFLNEMAKRDLEEAVFLTPPESLAFLVDLPRTDRKNFEQEAFLDPIVPESNDAVKEPSSEDGTVTSSM